MAIRTCVKLLKSGKILWPGYWKTFQPGYYCICIFPLGDFSLLNSSLIYFIYDLFADSSNIWFRWIHESEWWIIRKTFLMIFHRYVSFSLLFFFFNSVVNFIFSQFSLLVYSQDLTFFVEFLHAFVLFSRKHYL